MSDILTRLHAALPALRLWIDGLLVQHTDQSRPVSSLGYQRLSQVYPSELLNQAKIVSVPQTPFPPIGSMGLPEFTKLQDMHFGGITFLDTFFVSTGAESEALCFHELVHVVQWRRLGPDKFLLAYAIGLLQAGYENSPLEKMAYSLQREFECGTPQLSLVSDIEQKTDAIWARVNPMLQLHP